IETLEQPTPSLTVLNHPSLLLRTKVTNLLIDPWFEGTAFNNGWSLLDTSTSNDQVYAALTSRERNIIWYSHEHSDHLSISFLKNFPTSLKQTSTILFHRTFDKRIVNFLRTLNFNVKEQDKGRRFIVDDGDSICTFSHEED